MLSKTELRLHLRKIRQELSEYRFFWKPELLDACAPLFKPGQIVAGYAALGGEVGVDPLMELALDCGCLTALPYLEMLITKENQANGVIRMIHEFQTPLVAIRGAVDAMRTDIRKAGKKPTDFFRRDFPDLVVRWANLIGRLARNWRIFAAGKGSLPLKQRKLSLRAEVIMPVVDQVRGLLASGGRLEFECRGFDEIPQLWIDRDQFEQVFFNLLSNSCKYGGGTGTVRVEIVANEVAGNYCISYSDRGRGISEENNERIFEPGFRAKEAVFSDMSGQGLGLFVVRSVIQAHGGTICLTSCSQPTTFEIVLPRSLRDAGSVVRSRSQRSPES